MPKFRIAHEITPEDFELQVKAWIESTGVNLDSFSVTHREKIDGPDGSYEIDIVVRFSLFSGASFLMRVDCKKYKNSIKRELVQALRQKQISLGADKAMLVSTSDFQSGAIAFSQSHGIALVRLVSGVAMYIRGSMRNEASFEPAPDDADPYAGILYPTTQGLLIQPFSSQCNYGFIDFIKGINGP